MSKSSDYLKTNGKVDDPKPWGETQLVHSVELSKNNESEEYREEKRSDIAVVNKLSEIGRTVEKFTTLRALFISVKPI